MKRMIKLTIAVMCVMVLAAFVGSAKKLQVQQGIAKELIRFHVRAASDSPRDQELKLMVKDAVVEYLEPVLSESASIEESRQILEQNSPAIREIALAVLADNGSDSDVSVYFENTYFPMKSYGDITLPPGEYEAFRIDIGKADGMNWWCVLYPPLCFVDVTHAVVPDSSKEMLKNVLDEEEYNAITGEDVEFRFKYLTFLNFLVE